MHTFKKFTCIYEIGKLTLILEESSGSVVECLTGDRGVALQQQQNLGQRFGTSKMHLSPPGDLG